MLTTVTASLLHREWSCGGDEGCVSRRTRLEDALSSRSVDVHGQGGVAHVTSCRTK